MGASSAKPFAAGSAVLALGGDGLALVHDLEGTIYVLVRGAVGVLLWLAILLLLLLPVLGLLLVRLIAVLLLGLLVIVHVLELILDRFEALFQLVEESRHLEYLVALEFSSC